MPLPAGSGDWECEGCGRIYPSRHAARACEDFDNAEND